MDLETLEAIAKVLKCSPEYLLKEREPQEVA
jgi:DNA-binding Xre family transcriptional regulator